MTAKATFGTEEEGYMLFQWMKRSQVYGPSWMIIGISFVLMAVVIFMGGTNYHQGKTFI